MHKKGTLTGVLLLLLHCISCKSSLQLASKCRNVRTGDFRMLCMCMIVQSRKELTLRLLGHFVGL